MKPTTIYDTLFETLTPSTTVLTPNRRLAATLHKLYQQQQIAIGNAAWLTPDILPINSWQIRLWQDHLSTSPKQQPLLLSPTQEKLLWEQVITSNKRYESLLRTSETADKVCAAYGLLRQWQVNLANSELFQSAEDYRALENWIEQFISLCQTKKYLPQADLPDVLMILIAEKQLTLPNHILLVGFTDTSPQIKNLLEVCASQKTRCEEFTLTSSKPTKVHRLSLPDHESEIRSQALWAKQAWLANPNQRIGCVIPGIENIRDRVLQIFSETFANSEQQPFNITAGKSLSQYPIIQTALSLLSLQKQAIAVDLFSHLLFTPFIGESEFEQMRRAKFDRLLRQTNISKIYLPAIIEENSENRIALANHSPKLAKRLRQFFSITNSLEKTASFRTWAKTFNKLLTTLGFPGERSLNSEEYQIVESWLNLLITFESYDAISEPVSYQKAFSSLQKLCASTIFQAQSPDAAIQVMGLLEAAALPFDKLWIAGMDDLAWPPQPKPNPFIPKRLQRELQMPHATAERELHFCQTLMQQFSHASSELFYSHAEKNEELDMQPSALTRDYAEIAIENMVTNDFQRIDELVYQAKQLEWLEDNLAPPIQPHETLRGGINVIQHQAMCPFRSFARWRLHAQELESPVPGLRARDRGTIIHKVMELIWNKIQDHQTLLSLSEVELQNLIAISVDTALLISPPSHADFKQYLGLEKKRLATLVYDWLENEKNRAPFKVLTHEKRVDFTLGELNLSFRIDRIDILESGKQFIVDYKTGKYNDLNEWFSQRPEQPQLPLYALIEPLETVGIAFAQICAGDHGFKGVSRYAMEIKGIKLISEINKSTALSWEQQLADWQTILGKLGNDFSMGIAHVDPKEAEQTCQWCALKSLCRINEDYATHS